jgi:hypothetical protein
MVLGKPCNLKTSLKNRSTTCVAMKSVEMEKKVCKLHQHVHYHENAVFSLSLGKPYDEIHKYDFPFVLRNEKWL